MHKHPIVFLKDRLFIVEQGAHILLNTGSPYSFGNIPIQWKDDVLDLREGLELVDLGEISEGIGLRVDGVIGAEHLLEGPVFISMVEETLTLGVPQGVATVPIFEILIDGIPRRTLVDTAAKQSFAAQHLAQRCQRVGSTEDYLISTGTFKAELISAQSRTDHGDIPLSIAVAPTCLEPLLDQYDLEFVLGLDHILAEPSLLTSYSISPTLCVELKR